MNKKSIRIQDDVMTSIEIDTIDTENDQKRINNKANKNYRIDVDFSTGDEESSGRDTDEHFMDKLNNALQPLSSSKSLLSSKPWSSSRNVMNCSNNNVRMFNRQNPDHRASNSPVTLSRSSSETSLVNSYENGNTENTLNHSLNALQRPIKTKHFRKLSFEEIERSLDTFDSSSKLSNELDIIITYLNGQKHLYLHSKIYTHFKLNLLMVPTLLISTLVTALSQFIGTYEWSTIAIPILNASLTLLVSLVSYFKLESSSQIYANMATQYDKLQTVLEVANSRLIFLDDEHEQHKLLVKTIQEFEIKIFEIKDSNTIFIPERVKRRFQIISNINIFAFIKRIATHRKSLIYKYREAQNEMRYILYNIDDQETCDERCKLRLTFLTDIKTKIKDELNEYKNAYSYMDDAFVQEIKNAGFEKFWRIGRISGYRRHVVQNEIIKKHIPQF
jgi:hypothetical protein